MRIVGDCGTAVLELQHVLTALLVNDHAAAIVSFAQNHFVLRLKLNVILGIEVLLAVGAILVLLALMH